MEWIKCSERMADTMISVLVTGDWFHHAVSFWDGHRGVTLILSHL
jgi:hypothetical protein|nr:MAG TPA: Protein of unknown function (DUF551) [Caudoviricetes sp.]